MRPESGLDLAGSRGALNRSGLREGSKTDGASFDAEDKCPRRLGP